HIEVDTHVNRLKVHDRSPSNISSKRRLEAALSDRLLGSNAQLGRLAVGRSQARVLQHSGVALRGYKIYRGRRNRDKEIATADLVEILDAHRIVGRRCATTAGRHRRTILKSD